MSDAEIIAQLLGITGVSRDQLIEEVRQLKQSDRNLAELAKLGKEIYG